MKPDSMNAQQMLEELRKEMKQMFLAVMEANSRSPEQKQRVKAARNAGMREQVRNVHTVLNVGRRATSLVDAEPLRETGRDY